MIVAVAVYMQLKYTDLELSSVDLTEKLQLSPETFTIYKREVRKFKA